MILIIKIKMGVIFGPKLGLKIAKKWKERCFLRDFEIFYEINEEKNKGEKFFAYSR